MNVSLYLQIAVAGSSNAQNHNANVAKTGVPEEKLIKLMAEVKDVLCELGEGFIAVR